MTDTHTADHKALLDTYASRRYFKKFDAITDHLTRVAAARVADGALNNEDVRILTRYLAQLSYTFRALSMKYLLVGRETGKFFGSLSFDAVESGFPIFNELLVMANDAQQAETHLRNMPSVDELKDQMLRVIVGEREVPTKLQFALSQRLYYEELVKGDVFWAQNHPEIQWIGNVGEERRKFVLHWAVYDSQVNLPTIYLMDLEDSGRTALPKDERRWPEVQAHLMGQSLGALKLVTIAKGFDESFDDLHPKRLRRYHVGPMYSSAYTRQTGPIREVLEQARAPDGEDWALAWTVETLESERVAQEKAGWFSTVDREVFALDPFSGRGVDTGATTTERAIILPKRPYQVLEELNPPGFASVRKYVVSPQGRVLSY